MNTNRFPGYLTLIRPMNAQARQASTPVHISRHRRYERPTQDEQGEFGVASRHALLLRLDTIGELAPAAPLSFLMVKVIGLGDFDRECGEEGSDEVLRRVASTILGVTRATDMVGRMSGTGFGIVLQGTGCVGAGAVAARLAHHLGKAVQALPALRIEVAAATGTGINAETLPLAALDSFSGN